jgi:hypothetical protein
MLLAPPLSQNVTVFGDRVFEKVIKLKWNHYSGPLMRRGNSDADTQQRR